MIHLYRAKHRRSIVTDNRPHWQTLDFADVQNDARCSRWCARGVSVTFCPRHDADNYAESMARHATDSISRGPLSPVTGERVW